MTDEEAGRVRDFVGYGRNPPDPKWPGGAHVAVNFVINYEEGGERSSPLPADLKARCRDLGLQPIVGHTPIHIIAIDRRPTA